MNQAELKQKARDYLLVRGTEMPAAAVHERIAAAFQAFDAFLDDLPNDTVTRVGIPGEWTIQEIVDHLVETYRPGLDELRCLLVNRRPPGAPIPADLQSKAPLLRPWPWLRTELKRLHQDVLAELAAVPPDFTTEARAPFTMVINVPRAGPGFTPTSWVEELDWKAYAIGSWRLHALDHLNQAKKVRAAL